MESCISKSLQLWDADLLSSAFNKIPWFRFFNANFIWQFGKKHVFTTHIPTGVGGETSLSANQHSSLVDMFSPTNLSDFEEERDIERKLMLLLRYQTSNATWRRDEQLEKPSQQAILLLCTPSETHCHVSLINAVNYLGNGKGAILFYANNRLQTIARPAVGQEDADVTGTLKRGAFFLFSFLQRVLFFLHHVRIRSLRISPYRSRISLSTPCKQAKKISTLYVKQVIDYLADSIKIFIKAAIIFPIDDEAMVKELHCNKCHKAI
ncbi:hypothetical protein HNY73_021183 [Argiope bruennichi]|uniref:Uncharacterized protein n=1 Tax=Argiope bruennichi TaxID=94029 RepID=A0A8T0EBZ8_ARGBR|nr:hypothetical protein HNY73_021183 [Argiope bruennichi]